LPPAVMVAGGLGALSAGSQVVEGIQQKKAADAQAAVYQQQAGLARENAGMAISRNDWESNQLLATARASAAASGVTQGGSTKVVQQANYAEAVLRDTATRYSGELQASSDMAQAANARLEGKQRLYAGFIGAGKTALTSALGIVAPSPIGLGYGGKTIGTLFGP
jgi:hypothetical protein